MAILLTLLVFELTSLDMTVQKHLFDTASGNWILDRQQTINRMLFYDGAKILMVNLFIGMSVFLPVSLKTGYAAEYRKGICVVLLTMVFAPAMVSLLKDQTNMACPRNLQQFTGDVVYKKLFDRYPADEKPDKQLKCFPAAHASAGFALLSLYFLPAGIFARRLLLGFSLTAGTLMGGYKMLVGDHFLSHTLVSMELCWMLSCIFATALGVGREGQPSHGQI